MSLGKVIVYGLVGTLLGGPVGAIIGVAIALREGDEYPPPPHAANDDEADTDYSSAV